MQASPAATTAEFLAKNVPAPPLPAGEKSVVVRDGLGRTIMSINPEGDYSTMAYDAVSTPQADGAQAPLAATPINGDLLRTSATDANGNTSSSYSDGAGRTLATIDAANAASYAAYNAVGSKISYRDPNGLGEDCTLDALERDVSCADLQGLYRDRRNIG